MSRFKSKAELIADIKKERTALEALLAAIPDHDKLREVTDGMSVKDFIAHRTEWGRMMIRWYEEAKAGGTPKVPTADFKWNQLKQLNQAIHERFTAASLSEIEGAFAEVHDHLFKLVEGMKEDELFDKGHYGFTGTSDLATYVNSATASHYRSARRHIQKWWRARSK